MVWRQCLWLIGGRTVKWLRLLLVLWLLGGFAFGSAVRMVYSLF
jgi:hypothetical protein